MGKKRLSEKKPLEFAVPGARGPLLDLSDAIRSGACAANLLLKLHETRLAAAIGPDEELSEDTGYLIYALKAHMEAARGAYEALEAIRLEVPHA